MKSNRLRVAAVGVAALLLAGALVSPALGGPSLKKLVKKEVRKQVANKQGPAGLQGLQGIPGAPGQPGQPGQGSVLEGLNSPGGTNDATPPPFAETSLSRSATVTLSRAGRALVFATTQSNPPTCTATSCDVTSGLYLDDVPLAGTVGFDFTNSAGQSAQAKFHTMMAVTGQLTAGAHTIAVRTKSTGVASGGVQVNNIGALALGN
jgi:hypothetical protein